MSRAQRKLTALVAAAALLFSALSPAMAAVLFADRPDILARVLALPADRVQPADAAEQLPVQGEAVAHCPHDGSDPPAHHGGAASHDGDEAGEHAAHGIFCSFCLAASATLTLQSVPLALVTVVPIAAKPLFISHHEPTVARLPSNHRSRAPPAHA